MWNVNEEQKFEYYYYYFKNYISKEFPIKFEENKLCWYKNCSKSAIYTRHRYRKGMFCEDHKEDKMKTLIPSKTCEYKDCIYPAIYFNIIENTIRFCGIHRNKETRINLGKRQKEYPLCIDCKINKATHGYKNSNVRINCKNCKKDCMINIINRYNTCQEQDCIKIASFGYKDTKSMKFISCKAHKLQDMTYNKKRK